MSALKKVGIGIAIVLAAIVIVGLLLPAEYSAERSTIIDAPITEVFAQVDDLERYNTWSPWAERDPDIELTYSDQTVGLGAWYSWKGEVNGTGKLTITKSLANERIETELDFGDMGAAHGWWTFEQTDAGVKVTWGFRGDSGWNLFERYMGLMMDRMVGPDFERGLSNMKAQLEGT